MKIGDFCKFGLDRAGNLLSDLEDIKPAFEYLDKQGEPSKYNTGKIRQYLSVKEGDHPKTSEINFALGFLAYNDFVELEEDIVWDKSQNKLNEFRMTDYDEKYYDNLISYIEWKREKIGIQETQLGSIHEFDDFDPSIDYGKKLD